MKDGALVIDKPEQMTSHDVVARVRRAARTRRVGHAGTLDPFATGVLVTCIGRATRLVQFLVGFDKEYLATVRLGFATDTQDLTGKQVTPLAAPDELNFDGLQSVLAKFTGKQLQTPPMFSAKKVRGERLHRAARAGREVEREPVEISVYSLDLVEAAGSPVVKNPDGTLDFTVRVRCSSGTYVRTLAHDIGLKLGTGAHLSALRRTAVGHFRLSSAATLAEVEQKAFAEELESLLVSPADMLGHLDSVRLDEKGVALITTGREVGLTASRGRGPLRLLDGEGRLVAVGEFDDARKVVKPRVVLQDSVAPSLNPES